MPIHTRQLSPGEVDAAIRRAHALRAAYFRALGVRLVRAVARACRAHQVGTAADAASPSRKAYFRAAAHLTPPR